MDIKAILLLSLFTNSALAIPDDFCDENPDRIKFFESDDVYIITEFNFPDETPFADLITYTSKKYEHCENGCQPIAEHNAYAMASDHLWQEVTSTQGIKLRWSCGADIKCESPVLAENVRCLIEKGDCDALFWEGSPWMYTKIIEVYIVECRGDYCCDYENEPSENCCIVTSTVKS